MGALDCRRSGRLDPDVCRAALNRCPICKVLWAVEDPFSGYKDF
jgi:hypothetical protein